MHPRFDVRETDTSYELHGELPGLDKKDVHIEFTDPQTMVVRGRVERSYTSGTPPVGQVEDSAQPAAITEEGEHHDKEHQPIVQDEEEAKQAEEVGTEVVAEKPVDKAKYWVSERSIGEFSRSFHFPSHVDQDAVSASLKHGILSVEVPKTKKHAGRRIAIE
jgi:HSP20 family molecular chaperone IbpA